MKKLNKSKLKEMAKSFKDGATDTLTDKTSIIIAAFTGGLCSEGSITKGLKVTAEIMIKSAALNGVVRIGVDQVFQTVEDEELIED